MTRLLVQAALRDVERLRGRLEELLAGLDDDRKGVPAPLKKLNGRLTDAGIAALRAMISAGSTDTEIAREIDITPAAVRPHRARYDADKAQSRRKPRR